MKKIREERVINIICHWLDTQGWKVTNLSKTIKEGGIDIKAYRHGRVLWIEAKGDRKRYHQTVHNSFINALGQILFRMSREQKYRYYGIAIPASWENAWKKKIKQMRYGWSLLKPRVYLVYKNNDVKMKNWREMLK